MKKHCVKIVICTYHKKNYSHDKRVLKPICSTDRGIKKSLSLLSCL